MSEGEEFEAWGRKKHAWLRAFLPLPHGIASKDMDLRVRAELDARGVALGVPGLGEADLRIVGA